MGKNQHVTPIGDKWHVKGAGNSRATATYDTQKEAIAHAKQIAKNQQSELIIHNQKGQIRERSTYGKDPFPPKG